MIVILGETSRLTKSLIKYYKKHVIIKRAQYLSWIDTSNKLNIYNFFSKVKNENEENIIFITASILDPNRPFLEHLNLNFILVQNIIETVKDLGFKVVSFGTVMEMLISQNKQNNYVQSKFLLSEYVSNLDSNDKLNVTHFQLHTLYGVNQPSPHMFLGQILNAIMYRTDFNMSSGFQFREYHHFDDVVIAIVCFLTENQFGVIDISHGEPLRLRELAKSIFEFFEVPHLLQLGALPDPIDNYEKLFQKNIKISHIKFRNSLDGINNYLKMLLN